MGLRVLEYGTIFTLSLMPRYNKNRGRQAIDKTQEF
jgi:hypothetical protein